METWECKGRALLRYGRNVVLDVRLNRRETSKDGSGLCTQRARKQTLSRGLCGWEQFLNLVKSSQGWEAGRGQEYLSIFLPWYQKELCLQSPEENLLERMALPNVFSLWWTDIQECTPPSAHFCTACCCLYVSSWSLCLSVSASSNTFGH